MYVDNLPNGPKSPAMARGIVIHEAADSFVRGHIKNVPPALVEVGDLLKTLAKEYKQRLVRTELDVALNKDWNACHWMATDVYVRMKIDIVRLTEDKSTCRVIDWKTGKFKPVNSELGRKYDDALNLYSVGVLSLGFGRQASSQLVFTDGGETVDRARGTVALGALWREQKRWDNRVKGMLTDEVFAPRPGNYCRWCTYSCNKGGPCEY